MDRHLIKRVYWYIFVSIVYILYYYTEKLMYFFFRSDYLWLLSMLMTSPLVVTLGISLTVSHLLK